MTTYVGLSETEKEYQKIKRTFESLLSIQVHLLRLGNFLENLLDDDSVVDSDITESKLNRLY